MPKFSTFNAFGSGSKEVGQSHVPVWLDFVGPVPVGGTLDPAYAAPGFFLKAGAPVELTDKIIKPFISWEVVGFAQDDTYDSIIIKPTDGVLPAVGDFIQKVGATFSAKGKAAQVVSVEENDGNGEYVVMVAHSATIDSASEGDAIALSSATSAGSSKSLAVQPNGYLYNDIYLGDLDLSDGEYTLAATGAVVMYHHGGLLVELTPSAPVKAQMKAAVPGVLQVLV